MNRQKKNTQTRKLPKQEAYKEHPHYSSELNLISLHNDGEQKNIRGIDEKYFEAAAAVNPIVGGAIVDLLAPAQGVGVNQRVGDSLCLKRMFLHLDSTLSAAIVTNIMRIIIFQFKPNTVFAVPTVTDILQTAVYNSFREFSTSSQYVILYDEVFTQNGLTTAPSATTTLSDWLQIVPRKGFTDYVQFSPAATTGSGKIFMLHIGNNVGASNVLTYNSRVIYTDS